ADAGARCAFVFTARPSPSVDALVAAGAEKVECEALSPDGTRALVAATFGDAALLDGTGLGAALASGTRSALWVQESLRLAVEEGAIVRRDGRFQVVAPVPERPAEDVLAARLRLLPADARDVALASAVWGGPATAAELAAASGH